MELISWKAKSKVACKKHPKHIQSPGVCSICLAEKLSQLSGSPASSSKVARSVYSSSSSSSSVSYVSSSEASSCSSPGLEGGNSMRIFNKSRSMAFVSQRVTKEEDYDENNGKNGGFWSKLLTRSNRKLMHSTTMQTQRVTTAVY